MESKKIPSYKMVRELPGNAKVVKVINGIEIYNINVFQNIMSWNQHNLEVPALEFFGHQITYGELPSEVDVYAKGFKKIGIDQKTIVTMSMPVSNEYILSLFATCNLGLISNNVNFLFLRNNLARYTLEKKSDTLIVPDIYLPIISEQLKYSNLKRVIITSLTDYCPKEQQHLITDISRMPKKIREVLLDEDKMAQHYYEMSQLKNIDFIPMSKVLELGRNDNEQIEYPEVDVEKDAIYSYTSGTTGDPKCIGFKEQAANAIIEMHKGLNLRDYVGDRSLLLIPPSHATGMFYAAYLQLAKGKTLVGSPFYDKNTFAEELEKYKINHTLATAGFYLAGVAQFKNKPGAFSELNRPCSGGEPISLSNLQQINKWLKENGCQRKVAIGGGCGEVGSSALTSYFLNEETKTNETGLPIPGVEVKIIDPKTNKEVKKGERGIIHISSAASADRYLDNEKATNEFYYYEGGKKWANLGDIAVQNEDGSYSMLGRSTDSYIDETGERQYLFDIEYSLGIDEPVIEWEISAFKNNKKYDVVAQIILKDEYKGRESEVVEYLCSKYNLQGIKIYDEFETSEVTGKRDYQLLKSDSYGYLSPKDEFELYVTDYLNGNSVISTIHKDDVNTKKQTKTISKKGTE